MKDELESKRDGIAELVSKFPIIMSAGKSIFQKTSDKTQQTQLKEVFSHIKELNQLAIEYREELTGFRKNSELVENIKQLLEE